MRRVGDGVFYLTRPSPAKVRAVLAAQRALPLSYPSSGLTRTGADTEAPAGLPANHFRCCLGCGDVLYERALGALRRWAMYDLPWTTVYPRDAEVEAGQVIVVQARHFGFWSLNPCRVVYVEQHGRETGEHFAFALGTLPGHSERGEERFRLERRGDEVWFEILAFAGPRHPLTWLGYPLLRTVHRRFARAAATATAKAVR